MAKEQSCIPLLQLPDPCLVAILCCCAHDPRSMFSAARAHSRLHQAAVMAASSITAVVNQQQLNSLVATHLAKHGPHIHGMSLEGAREPYALYVILRQLPDNLTQLSTLNLNAVDPQLQPGWGYPGVLGAAAPLPLKQLRLKLCRVLDNGEGLIAALARLPGLEHLSIVESHNSVEDNLYFPLGEVLPGLQQLTFLELDMWLAAECEMAAAQGAEDAGEPVPNPFAVSMQHLSVLTRLADLRLPGLDCNFSASMLSGVHTLTRLQLAESAAVIPGVTFDPAVLAGKTLLQHLELEFKAVLQGATGVQLLSQLQQQQQLTCLVLHDMACSTEPCPPAAAYVALTASSKLQHLDISRAIMPAGAWQHVFPASRQLPHLWGLNISQVKHPGIQAPPAAAPEGTRLVSCCPALQCLYMQGLQHKGVVLSALQGLSSLHTLHVRPVGDSTEGLQGVLQLTGLRELVLADETGAAEGLLLQLTQLRQLTTLDYAGLVNGCWKTFQSEARSSEPVWAQVLWHHRNDPNHVLAQQAAAAVAHAHRVQ